MFYKTSDLIRSIKVRSIAPNSQSTYQTEDFLLLANEKLGTDLMAAILEKRASFFERVARIPLVASVPRYPIPERAAGNALKKLFYVDAKGIRTPLRQVDMEHQAFLSGVEGEPSSFMMVGDEVYLLPAPKESMGHLELWHFARPNRLVEESDVGRIEAITDNGETVTFEIGSDLTANVTPGAKVDFLSVTSPFLLWSDDVEVLSITGSTVEVAKSAVTNEAGIIEPRVGDYVCPAGTAHIPQVPQELHPVLAQMVAVQVLEGLGDAQKLSIAMATLDRTQKLAFQMITNRVESELEPVTNRHGIAAALG